MSRFDPNDFEAGLLCGFALGAVVTVIFLNISGNTEIGKLHRHIEILASDVEDLSDLVPHTEIARRACVDVDQALAEIPVRED